VNKKIDVTVRCKGRHRDFGSTITPKTKSIHIQTSLSLLYPKQQRTLHLPHTHSSSHCPNFSICQFRISPPPTAESFELRRPTLRYVLAGRFRSLPNSLPRPPLIANRRFAFQSLFNSLVARSQLHVLTF